MGGARALTRGVSTFVQVNHQTRLLKVKEILHNNSANMQEFACLSVDLFTNVANTLFKTESKTYPSLNRHCSRHPSVRFSFGISSPSNKIGYTLIKIMRYSHLNLSTLVILIALATSLPAQQPAAPKHQDTEVHEPV